MNEPNEPVRRAHGAYDREIERRRMLHTRIVSTPSKEYRVPGAVSTVPPEGELSGRTMSPKRWADRNRGGQ